MKFKFFKPLTALATMSLVLSACGGGTPTATNSPATSPTAGASPASSPGASPAAGKFTVGVIMVGPKNDKGWSQGHYEAVTEYVTQKIPDVKVEFVDKVNPADRPNVKGSQVADDLIAKGAQVIIFNSDDFKDDALATAQKHPKVTVIHASGDYAWKDGKNFKNLSNLGNFMPEMEYGRMLTGCVAALSSESGKIGFLGPLINDETRRLVSATYLGARHCWEKYRQKDAKDLDFKVTWIGFWFNIPGVTLDPTKVADEFYNGGYDVVISGIDTPEAGVQAKKAVAAGKKVQFTSYGLKSGCDTAPEVCLGVPVYNWGPAYTEAVKQNKAGSFKGEFIWGKPDWKDLNSADTSSVGFVRGKALTEANGKSFDEFIKTLGDKSVNLYQGPLKFQDGTDFLKAGETATPQQIWYMPQLLQGIQGSSK